MAFSLIVEVLNILSKMVISHVNLTHNCVLSRQYYTDQNKHWYNAKTSSDYFLPQRMDLVQLLNDFYFPKVSLSCLDLKMAVLCQIINRVNFNITWGLGNRSINFYIKQICWTKNYSWEKKTLNASLPKTLIYTAFICQGGYWAWGPFLFVCIGGLKGQTSSDHNAPICKKIVHLNSNSSYHL